MNESYEEQNGNNNKNLKSDSKKNLFKKNGTKIKFPKGKENFFLGIHRNNIKCSTFSKKQPNNKIKTNNIIIKNMFKHNSTPFKKEIMMINDLIDSKSNHYIAIFKDYLISDYIDEFLRRFYRDFESQERLPKFASYYKNYLCFFCKPTFCDFYMNEIIQDYGETQAELYYNNNYGRKEKEKRKKEKEKEEKQKGKSKNGGIGLIKSIFTKTIKNSIDRYMDNSYYISSTNDYQNLKKKPFNVKQKINDDFARDKITLEKKKNNFIDSNSTINLPNDTNFNEVNNNTSETPESSILNIISSLLVDKKRKMVKKDNEEQFTTSWSERTLQVNKEKDLEKFKEEKKININKLIELAKGKNIQKHKLKLNLEDQEINGKLNLNPNLYQGSKTNIFQNQGITKTVMMNNYKNFIQNKNDIKNNKILNYNEKLSLPLFQLNLNSIKNYNSQEKLEKKTTSPLTTSRHYKETKGSAPKLIKKQRISSTLNINNYNKTNDNGFYDKNQKESLKINKVALSNDLSKGQKTTGHQYSLSNPTVNNFNININNQIVLAQKSNNHKVLSRNIPTNLFQINTNDYFLSGSKGNYAENNFLTANNINIKNINTKNKKEFKIQNKISNFKDKNIITNSGMHKRFPSQKIFTMATASDRIGQNKMNKIFNDINYYNNNKNLLGSKKVFISNYKFK